ncbi:MAG: hypothetical protein KC620_18320, partial [Myxococcales bacterium]|nr:hypothetical protein [Myxococcales bacterium]
MSRRLCWIALCALALAGCDDTADKAPVDATAVDGRAPDRDPEPDARLDAAPDAMRDAMRDGMRDAAPDAIADAIADATADAIVDACPANPCGGCAPLPAAPDDPCGCDTGTYVCAGPDALDCQGADPRAT